ncbi:hypothetical protein KI387_002638, partial [Taxus chinensis]
MKCKWSQVQVILLLCFSFVWVEVEYVQYKDPSQPVMARAENLLRRMTLEEKFGQMTQNERTVASTDVMKQYYSGGVLSGGGSVPAPKASPADWVSMGAPPVNATKGIPYVAGQRNVAARAKHFVGDNSWGEDFRQGFPYKHYFWVMESLQRSVFVTPAILTRMRTEQN